MAHSTKTKPDDPDTTKGVAAYSPSFLSLLYDRLVLGLYISYAWRCPTKTQLLPFFIANSSPADHPTKASPTTDSSPPRRLLDIGVGTGYFLEHAPLTSLTSLTLIDLNSNCLDAATARVHKAHPHLACSTVQADFLAPLPAAVGADGKFDAISVMLLLHCVPGPPSRKAAALVALKGLLKADGVLFGSTVLGQGVRHNLLGRFLMWWHNRAGIFTNRDDAAKSFVEPLQDAFDDVKWRVVGATLLFEARGPRA
ncbi:hypothetical protein SLS56_006664 [Neofusicoccum ribis]|uniref:Methyltransferase domain-containing protein n=1 Tax=Neofusicoccum ribis TaxID=45134 RepID=A0ABR3SR06_9PEZI